MPTVDASLISAIESAWENRDGVTTATAGETRDAVETALAA
ncbi:MAG: 2,3,4,5-tetrahydropyridine-2,6-dicarboxylate N-succinyltransferase, partial [Pseudomonadota bacterium]